MNTLASREDVEKKRSEETKDFCYGRILGVERMGGVIGCILSGI